MLIFTSLPLSYMYMDFLIFVGEVIWALAGFLDLLKTNPLADFLMGGFLNARASLYFFLLLMHQAVPPSSYGDGVMGPQGQPWAWSGQLGGARWRRSWWSFNT
jgi:hypothetical protein